MQGPMSKRKQDEDADEEVSPWADVRKNLVMQEARMFHNPQLNAPKCTMVLTKVLYLINTGETFSNDEAIDLFFAVTKLFQSPDVHLRRIVYLIIKELKIESDSSLIVVSCLSKDMTSKIDLFRANSIRVLAKIMDASMVGQMERFLKQALVDKNPFIMASTLCAGQHLFQTAPDVIKRWLAEIQEALNSKARMVQYHALALLYRVKQHDKLAINKVVTSLARSQQTSHSPMAQCLHIRLIFNQLQTTPGPLNPELLKYLLDLLHNKHFMVMYEAARSIVRLDAITAVQCVPAISVLQELLVSQLPAQRFAAVRTLSEVVVRFPLIVAPCVVDLEHLITDPNRNIATLAITTLLKTGVESNVDRLMKSIGGFMSDISDEFKIVLVDAIRTLCLKFPHKYPTLLNFLAASLREEGGYKFKKAIVESMLLIMADIKEATEIGLEQCCEFIEDCIDGDALVNMADGTSRRLKEVRAGDRVLAWDENGLFPSTVTKAVCKGAQECVELLFSDGRKIVCTPDHRILTADKKWVTAGELVVGSSEVTVGVEFPRSDATEVIASERNCMDEDAEMKEQEMSGRPSSSGPSAASPDVVRYAVPVKAKRLPTFLVKLVGRRAVGMKEVYDITVPQGTSFVAAGIVVHNCEFPELSVRILHVLGDRGPLTSQPNKYIRFIFNRVILETAAVRCAAVSSLAKFGQNVPHLTNHIIILLKRCLMDNDDEVRDRAIFYSNLLSSDSQQIKNLMSTSKLPGFNHLEHSLALYLESGKTDQPFSMTRHLLQAPIDENEQAAAEQKQKLEAEGGLNMNEEKDAKTKAQHAAAAAAATSTSASNAQQNNAYIELFNTIPELKELGTIFKSCSPVELTETETEYVVTCVKHILPQHVVFQFQLTNTLEEHQLENVRVEMEAEDDAWQEELSIPEPILKANVPGTCFVVFNRPADSFTSGSLSCTLHFTVKEVDDGEVESGPGSADEYQLEDIEIVEHDFMKPGEENVGLVQFRSMWEGLGEGQEVLKRYSLGLDSLQAAVNAVAELLGMQPSENSGIVPDGARNHAVNLTGIFFGNVPVLARAGFMLDAKHGVKLTIAVRSANPQVNNMLTNAIR